MEALRNVHHSHVEIWSINHLCGCLQHVAIMRAVILGYVEVYGILCQFGVELAWLAVESWAVIIEYAVCHIT